MRLFIGVTFDAKTKENIQDIQIKLKEYAIEGRFTDKANLHLTLIFIGEVYSSSVNMIKKIMNSISFPPFQLQFNDVGSFKRQGGNICWLGVNPCSELSKIHSQLAAGLTHSRIRFDNRPYSPHLTLARSVILKKNFDKVQFSREISRFNVDVNQICLMNSERLSGKLTYTEIYTQNFRL